VRLNSTCAKDTPTVAQLAALLLLLLTTKRPLAALMGSSSSAVQWQGTRELTTVLVCSTANVTAAVSVVNGVAVAVAAAAAG
jgi:hypothetical protein